MGSASRIREVLDKYETALLTDWLREIIESSNRQGLLKEDELREECREFIKLFRQAVQRENLDDIYSFAWGEMREFLVSASRERSQKGFTPSETASFVFSFKQPLFAQLRQEFLQNDSQGLLDSIVVATTLIDKLGLFTTEVFQKAREDIIRRQQDELLELSTPVVKLWDGILGLPIIGTLDSARTQVVMESLLQKIVETGSEVAIIDITGVPTVDTLTAQHLLKTITAARLMGADCIISGVRPQIAQTIVYLGVDLSNVVTKSTLADAFALALKQVGLKVIHTQPQT